MDILGFFSFIGLWIYGRQRGITRAIAASLRETNARGKLQFKRLKVQYDVLFAGKTVALLVISAAVQAILLTAVLIVLGVASDEPLQRPWFLIIGAIIAICAQVGYAIYMSKAIPRHVMENGKPKRYPRFYQDNDAHFTTHDGRVLTYEQDVYGQTLANGQAGTILNLNDEGRVLRFYQDANGHLVDALTAQPLVYANGHAKRLNPRGLTLRFYQENGVWFDGVDGTPLAQAPAMPNEVLADEAINRLATIDSEDRRVEHDLADLPMLDRSTSLNRHSLLLGGSLVVGSMFLMGLCVIWLGLLNGTSNTVPFGSDTLAYTVGNRWVVLFGGLYLLIGSVLAYNCAWIVMSVYAATIQTLEFIAGIVIEQGLIVLPGITVNNIASRFTGAKNFIDEMKHKSAVLGVILEARLSFLIWFIPVVAFPNAPFASFMILLMVLQGLADHLYTKRGGEQQVLLKREQIAAMYSNYIVAFLVIVSILLALSGIRNAILAQIGNLVEGIQAYLNGNKSILVPTGSKVTFFGLFTLIPAGLVAALKALLIIAIGAALASFAWSVKKSFDNEESGTLSRMTGKVFGLGAIFSSLVALLGGAFLLAILLGVNELRMPRSSETVLMVPAAPSNVDANINPDYSVTVTWKDNSENEKFFRIERKVYERTTFGPLYETDKDNTFKWQDSSVEPGTTYCYRVLAVNDDGPSKPSEEQCFIVPAKPEEKKAPTTTLVIPTNVPSKAPVRLASAPAADDDETIESCTPKFVKWYMKRNNGQKPSCAN